MYEEKINLEISLQKDDIRVPVFVSKFLLREDDILDQKILYYDNLVPVIKLNKEKIKIIQNLPINNVKVLRLQNVILQETLKEQPSITEETQEETSKLEKFTATDINKSFTDNEQDKKLYKVIKETINNIRGNDFQEMTESTIDRLYQAIDKESIGEGHNKIEFEKNLQKIASNFSDIFSLSKVIPIKEKTKIESLTNTNNSVTTNFLDLVIADKVNFINGAKALAINMINSFGDDTSGFILSSIFNFSGNDDYIVSHSLFVMSLSIVIAKEMTKLVHEKLLNNADNKKLNASVLKAIQTKTFNFEEIINLGLITLLHDIGLRKNFGKIKPDFKFSKTYLSKIELHPSESMSFAQKLNLDVHILRAIYQHHEFLDGSGYPKATTRYFSKYSPIVAFVERISDLILPSPFYPKDLPPPVVINYILSKELQKYDKDVVYSFIRGTSSYPIGSWVKLSNGLIGLVIKISPKDSSKQIIKVIFTEDFRKLKSPETIDLSESNIKITGVISVKDLTEKIGNIRNFIFD